MITYSPLRYPGGKNRLSKFMAQVCIDNNLNAHYVEPYAGGAAVALHLLFEGKVSKVTINDYDRSIFAFWHSVLYETEALCDLILNSEIDMMNWEKSKEIQRHKDTADLLELGFSTLFLNRTNYSGVIGGGVIGGREQKGKYKLDCRFNKIRIVKQIKAIASRRNQIEVSNLDALELIKSIPKDSKTIFYFDPPYFEKGQCLYLNHYKPSDHKDVSEAIKSIKNAKWIVSYDDKEEIRGLYKDFRSIRYKLSHSVNKVRQGGEILFVSDNIKTLDFQKHPVLDYKGAA